MNNNTYLPLIDSSVYGIGRRKESTAVVYLLPFSTISSSIKIEINGRSGEDYFQQNFSYLTKILAPFKTVKLKRKYNIIAKVKGGGLTGQADSIKLAISRALCKIDRDNFRPLLKTNNLLTRDSRIKERRKYGLKKARKSSQYSKR